MVLERDNNDSKIMGESIGMQTPERPDEEMFQEGLERSAPSTEKGAGISSVVELSELS